VTDVASSTISPDDLMGRDQDRAIVEARAAVAADVGSEAAAAHLTLFVRERGREAGDEPDPLLGADRTVRDAAALLNQGKDEEAEVLLRQHLARNRNDPQAMLLMAEIASKCGFPENAEKILRRSIELHPARIDNRVALAKLLHGVALAQDKFSLVEELIQQLDEALRVDPEHWGALSLKASIAMQIRRLDEAKIAFERMLERRPGVSFVWMNYAYLLKTIGSFGEAVAAYRMAIALDPSNGGAWWGLANLKIFHFFPSDIVEMEKALSEDLTDAARVEIRFALSKAFDDLKDYARAAEHLLEGNRLRLTLHPYEAEQVSKGIDEAIETYSPDFFVQRTGRGHPSSEPIFIVGMPRAGSTLIEQILASHSLVEGTEELFAMQQLDGELQQAHADATGERALIDTDLNELRRLGERYLHLAHYHRKTERPYFTDKNPANWRYVGLIHTILPNAKIVDVRRNPLDCCFANYAQHYQWGVNFSYGQREVASQYREYLRLMRHFDQVLPGIVHHAIHDQMVDNFECEVRRLLDYLELPFEEACLRFFETKRAVHTPSAEQVRRPINRSGFGRWRNYERWIGDLKESLGDVLNNWQT
jgi:tetratricopeptide (TPR) repeat protein